MFIDILITDANGWKRTFLQAISVAQGRFHHSLHNPKLSEQAAYTRLHLALEQLRDTH